MMYHVLYLLHMCFCIFLFFVLYFIFFFFFYFFLFCYLLYFFFFFFFFFQAEDGIRDADVTGVQTCALPICFSSNKFGVVLKTCTPDDLTAAAERFLAVVREDVVQTEHGPVATTITIGAVAAPRHARTVDEILAHAQESLDAAKAKRRGSYLAYRPNV